MIDNTPSHYRALVTRTNTTREMRTDLSVERKVTRSQLVLETHIVSDVRLVERLKRI